MVSKPRDHDVVLRPPTAADGATLHELIGACPPLDTNSMYCNLLQCSHFSATSVVAQAHGGLLGAVTGYLVPHREDTLFIWQVAVAEQARGAGLGRRMLDHILVRQVCARVTHLETTVTGTNLASWAMFEGFARHWDAPLQRSVLFDRSTHFVGKHETEVLARIGPLPDFAARERQTATDTHGNDHRKEQSA